MPEGWLERVKDHDVGEITVSDNVFRISSNNGPATTVAVLEAGARRGIEVKSLSVQSTTLDDGLVHYTGNQLRDDGKRRFMTAKV